MVKNLPCNTGDMDLIPGWRTEILEVAWHGQRKKGTYKVRGLKKVRIDKGTKMVQQGQKPTQYCKAIILQLKVS